MEPNLTAGRSQAPDGNSEHSADLVSLVEKERQQLSVDQRIDGLPALNEAERKRILCEWNDTAAEYPREKCLHQLFEEQVEKTPDATAVLSEGAALTYGELNRRASQLAHYLRDLGVRPDGRVAICVERGFEMIIGLLAILKAGGAYVPLDPEYPVERLRYMLEDSGPVVLVTQGYLQGLFSDLSGSLPIVNLTCGSSAWQDQPESNPDSANVGLATEHLVYVIYTSGSTGAPKGVMNTHAGIVNRLHWMQQAYHLHPFDSVLQKTSFGFDVSVWELFWPLLAGARLVMARPRMQKDPEYLVEAIHRDKITTIHFVPSMLQAFLDQIGIEECVTLARVVCSGEALSTMLVTRFHERLPNTELHNLYGPTEAAVDVTAWTCPRGQPIGCIIPIGRPIANTKIYILDATGEPVPVGVAGEIYIGGVGVARGYLNRPELTAERFLPDRFRKEAGARMYRTGDLGRWLEDGTIEFLGRNDDQVKIRGFRIELGEVEAVLAQHAGVREAAVIAREDTPGDKRLVAYYTVSHGTEGIGAEEIRAHLTAKLPEYMVPAAYVRLESMPLTVNGKLDRKGLPAPGGDAYAVREYEAPQGEIETKLAKIWAEVLHVERVGRHDNFFEMGGHSLLAVRVIAHVQQAMGLMISLGEFFARPVLGDFARSIEGSAAATLPPIVHVDHGRRLPLSYGQRRLWFLAQMNGISEAYHIPYALRLQGGLNRAALHAALDYIIRRHEVLRTSFAVVNGEPEQRIAPEQESHFYLVEHDIRKDSDMEGKLGRLIAEEGRTSFDLEKGPLIRGRLIHLGEDEHALLITMHHIVSDGWSIGVFMNELSALYGAFLRGDGDPLPKLEVQYADYAVWQRKWIEGDILQKEAKYWKETLSGAPLLLELPGDHARPPEKQYAGAFVGLELDGKLTAGLKELARRYGTTLYVTLLAGWGALLARLSGQTDVVIGTPVAGRGQREIEGLIGFFVNTLVLRLDVSGSPTVGELLERVKGQAVAAQENQDIPFEKIVEIIGPMRSLSHSPLFEVMFAWQNAPEGRLELAGLKIEPLQSSSYRAAKFDLTLSLQESGERIVGWAEYATSLFEQSTIQRYLGYFQRLLEGMVVDDAQTVDRLPILGGEEREKVLYEWNDTAEEYPREKCIQELFEEQVLKSPDAVAVVFEEQQLSYAELNRRANQLAHYLIQLGVRPDDRVAICVERGPEMVVGLLAILKAGGAYVPLDPVYPAERLRFMVEDSDSVVLLTQNHLRFPLEISPSMRAIDLGDATLWQDQPHTNVDCGTVGIGPHHLAYIIYTSGSTGNPKGVMVEHRNVVRLFSSTNKWFQFGQSDVWTLFHSYSFDFSVWEMWGALLYGGRLVVVSRQAARSTEVFYKLICHEKVTVLNQTPSAFQQLAEVQAGSTESHQLRYVILGGEYLDTATLMPWYAQNPGRETRLINMYGITETTVHVTYRELGKTDAKNRRGSPIGCRIPDLRIYILDRHRQPVPIGVAGEIYVGGAGVARGYLNRPDLTAERFIANPFVEGDRLYKTGDLARYLPDETIEFLGRNDFQVKVRGYRIELGEIEGRLAEHPGVREAAVIAREDTPGDKRLVAYYTVSHGTEGIGAEEIRAHLTAKLPEYMVPAAYVRLESMPLTVNGKLDRKGLPAPGGDAYAVREYEAPQGEIETKLAKIWAEVLHVERVGRHDNFFEMGGHSLLALAVANLLNQIGIKILAGDLFAQPTIQSLAAKFQLDDGGTAENQTVCIRRGRTPPLFIIHDGFGETLYIYAMNSHIDADISIYAVLPSGPSDEAPLRTVEEMARRMLPLIRAIQPVGPYLVAGWSFGGTLAYEIATQLIDERQKVDFVGLFDTSYSAGITTFSARPVRDFNDKTSLLFSIKSQSKIEGTLGPERQAAIRDIEASMAMIDFPTLVRKCRERLLLPDFLRPFATAQIRQFLESYHALGVANRLYRARRLPIPVYLFSCVERRKDTTDPMLGWNSVVPANLLRVIPVTGNHFSIMGSPNIETLCEALVGVIHNIT